MGFGVTPRLFSFRAGKPVEAVAHNMQWSLEWRHVQIRTVLLGISSGHPTMLWICSACIPQQNEVHKQPLIHCMQLFPQPLKRCAQAYQHLQQHAPHALQHSNVQHITADRS